MTRIIAGTAKGRHLKVPTTGTRPTSDRVRESVFSSLDHLVGAWDGLAVLDLYAGSGAFGIEALSRGAQSATLVDQARAAVAVANSNVALTGLAATVVGQPVEVFLKAEDHGRFDVVFADPPYDIDTLPVGAVLERLVGDEWLHDGAIVLVERSQRTPPLNWPDGFTEPSARRFGDTVIYRSIWYVS